VDRRPLCPHDGCRRERPLSLAERLDRLRVNAGLQMSTPAMLLFGIGLISLGLLRLWVEREPDDRRGAACAVAFILYTLIHHRANKQQQFLNSNSWMRWACTRSLRAGIRSSGLFQLVASEMEPPVSRIFADICQQESPWIAWTKPSRRRPINQTAKELRLFAHVGQSFSCAAAENLADMMERMAVVIRERMRLARRVRVA